MEQRCHLAAVWLTWIGVPLLALLVGLRAGLVAALVVLAAGALGQVLYVRWFPRISRWVGYGSVEDMPAAEAAMPRQLPRVTLYTANVCPFCPIIKRRLAEMQRHTPFEIEEIDITFRPEIVLAKGLRSVPVMEVNGRRLIGNATSAQIADFLRTAALVPGADEKRGAPDGGRPDA